MPNMSPPSYNLPLFDGKMDFSIWKLKLKCILILESVHNAIDLSYSATETEEKKSEMNERALSTIMLHLSDSVLKQVSTIESAKELWDTLDRMYTKTFLPSRMLLLEKFINFKLDSSKGISENLECFYKLIEDIKLSGDEHIDDYTAFVLLNAIPECYSDVKSAIKSAVEYGIGDLSVDSVVNALKCKEDGVVNALKGKEDSVVNALKGKENSGVNAVKGKEDSVVNALKGKENSVVSALKAKDCAKKQDKQSKHGKNMSPCNCTQSYGKVFLTYMDGSESGPVKETEWLVYTGCTWHMTPLRNVLSNYKHIDNGFVSMANGSKSHVAGLGDVCLKFSSGFVHTLRNVRHVPDLRDNLLSVGALGVDGLCTGFGKDGVEISKGSAVMCRGERRDSVYVCHAEPSN